jgi:hypothetical protein
MTSEFPDFRNTKQYLLRFVFVPVVLLVATWFLTKKDLRATSVLLVGILAFNAFYWLLRYMANNASSFRKRLEQMGDKNPLLPYQEDRNQTEAEEEQNSQPPLSPTVDNTKSPQ